MIVGTQGTSQGDGGQCDCAPLYHGYRLLSQRLLLLDRPCGPRCRVHRRSGPLLLAHPHRCSRSGRAPPATAAAGAGDQPPESEEPPEARDPFAPVDKRAVLEPELYDPLGAISPFEEELPLEESLDAPPGYDPAFDTSVPVEESLDPPLGHDPALDPSFPIEEPLNPSPGYDPAFDTSSPWEVARPDPFDLPPDLPTAETPLPSPDARHFGFDDEPLIPVAPIEPNPASADPASADLASPRPRQPRPRQPRPRRPRPRQPRPRQRTRRLAPAEAGAGIRAQAGTAARAGTWPIRAAPARARRRTPGALVRNSHGGIECGAHRPPG